MIRKKSFHLLFIALLTPFLSQCVATQQEMRSLDLRLRTMDNRMVTMNREIDGLQNKTGESATVTSVEFMQKRFAELSDQYDSLNTEILQVKSRYDESLHNYRTLQKENNNLREDFSARVRDLHTQVEDLRKQLDQANLEIANLEKARVEDAAQHKVALAKAAADKAATEAKAAAEKAAQAARDAAEKAARMEEQKTKSVRIIEPDQLKKKPSDETPSVKAAKETVKEIHEAGKEIYDKAIALFNKKEFKDAYNKFAEYTSEFPSGSLAANARFWLGDCLFNLEEYELALVEYQNVIADYPDHSKAPAALFKQGLAFEKLNEAETAKRIYQKLLEDYPKSDQVEPAKKRLAALK